MIRLAFILRLIRAATALAVVLMLGVSLPSAAHAVFGHHETGTMEMAGGDMNDAPDASHHRDQSSQTTPAEYGNCCIGACVALDVVALKPSHGFLQYEIRWAVADAKLASLDLITLLRPPKT